MSRYSFVLLYDSHALQVLLAACVLLEVIIITANWAEMRKLLELFLPMIRYADASKSPLVDLIVGHKAPSSVKLAALKVMTQIICGGKRF